MPLSPKENWDESASPELDIQQTAGKTAVDETTSGHENALVAESIVPRFGYRVLVVDDEPGVYETTKILLEREGYEVLTAADGLDGLEALSKSLPDLIISDLNMPRMSGFEFLGIVRTRFPHIATIAMSATDSRGKVKSLSDAFLSKGQFTVKELVQEVKRLLAASPIRSQREKRDIAPLYVPRDSAGYLILTCPRCLRPSKLAAMSLDGGIHETTCQSCRAPVKFEINHEVEPLMKRESLE